MEVFILFFKIFWSFTYNLRKRKSVCECRGRAEGGNLQADSLLNKDPDRTQGFWSQDTWDDDLSQNEGSDTQLIESPKCPRSVYFKVLVNYMYI